MLAYFHTGLVPFTSLPSDYLVAHQTALIAHENEETTELFDFESPEVWFSDSFDELEGQREWNSIRPCSPHAMFRLADCYGIGELKELAKGRITRSFTIENVRAFLLCKLSITYVLTKLGVW